MDPLSSELEGELESVLYTAFWFVEAAIVLPRYRALLLADTGGSGWQGGGVGWGMGGRGAVSAVARKSRGAVVPTASACAHLLR